MYGYIHGYSYVALKMDTQSQDFYPYFTTLIMGCDWKFEISHMRMSSNNILQIYIYIYILYSVLHNILTFIGYWEKNKNKNAFPKLSKNNIILLHNLVNHFTSKSTIMYQISWISTTSFDRLICYFLNKILYVL